MSFSRLGINSLSANLLSLFLSLYLLSIILSNSSFECLSALTLTNMFNSNMESLWYNSVSNFLVNDNSNCMLGHIKYLSSSSVVEFVRHTFVNATVSHYINEVTFFVDCENFRERSGSVLSEALLEKMSSLRPISKVMRHLYS